ncbi:MAG TPA: OB-fold domain-containing protein [Hyphomicrobiaceae bacterium]|jgi:uncharacterized OB-fold protein|nr:OB-fold domain-containing protein [Hyphomicrobiaceae bacterium]
MTIAPSSAAQRPLPGLDGPERPFWEGLRQRLVRVQRCDAEHYRFPASRYCPVCHSTRSSWETVAPEGVVESFCVFHKPYFPGLAVPYAVVQVRLGCGVRLFSNLAGVANEDIRIGMRVVASFEDVSSEVTLLKFRPKEGGGA